MMLTCREASRLLSQAEDQSLPRRERLELRLHVWLCRHCANFEQQLKFLRTASRRLAEAASQPDRIQLGAEARERIRQAVRR